MTTRVPWPFNALFEARFSVTRYRESLDLELLIGEASCLYRDDFGSRIRRFRNLVKVTSPRCLLDCLLGEPLSTSQAIHYG